MSLESGQQPNLQDRIGCLGTIVRAPVTIWENYQARRHFHREEDKLLTELDLRMGTAQSLEDGEKIMSELETQYVELATDYLVRGKTPTQQLLIADKQERDSKKHMDRFFATGDEKHRMGAETTGRIAMSIRRRNTPPLE